MPTNHQIGPEGEFAPSLPQSVREKIKARLAHEYPEVSVETIDSAIEEAVCQVMPTQDESRVIAYAQMLLRPLAS